MICQFKNRRRIAIASFITLIIIVITSIFGIEIKNSEIVTTIVICLTSIVIAYYTGSTVEQVKKEKYNTKGIKND